MISFSAALLAGGQSRRMGRDKALLPLPNSNQVLWQRQLGILAELKPTEMFWSGPSRPDLPAHIEIVPDRFPGAGPLAGLSACLESCRTDLLVVLAIDLPRMTSAFLRLLLEQSSRNTGALARSEDQFQPLAAVYPKSLAPLATSHLEARRYALRDLVTEAVREERLGIVELGENDSKIFTNWNSPQDVGPTPS